MICVARQLGDGAELTLRTYGHLMEELEGSPRLSVEQAINLARMSACGTACAFCTRLRGPVNLDTPKYVLLLHAPSRIKAA